MLDLARDSSSGGQFPFPVPAPGWHEISGGGGQGAGTTSETHPLPLYPAGLGTPTQLPSEAGSPGAPPPLSQRRTAVTIDG